MAYGLDTRAFVEGGPVEQVKKLQFIRSTARAWQALNSSCRLAIVEEALSAANDHIDGLPLAL